MEGTSMRFGLEPIAHLLQDRQLAVPIYQRSYSWTREEVDEFWEDVRTALQQPNPEYFLGTIVLSREGVEGRSTIIDGQQRLATTAILLAGIRDEFHRRGDGTRAQIVQQSLVSADLRSGENLPRLQLNSEDDAYFRKVVIDGDDVGTVERSHPSNALIADALKTLRRKIQEVADSIGSEWANLLLNWHEFLGERVLVVAVEVPTEADAFLIFETLNDRGADLTIADLLKNYLFGRAGHRLDIVRDGWLLSLGALEMSAENETFITFLRHYWSSRYGATRERELYKSIKERVTNESQAVDFIEELKREARLYAALLNTEHEFWSTVGTGTKQDVETVLRLNLEQIRPLFLAVMKHFPEPELKKVLRSAVSWAVRGLIVGGIGGGTYEKRYCEAAVKIREGDIKTDEELFAELSAIIPSDSQFKSAFSEARVNKSTLARYYLSALERGERNEEEPELVPNQDEEQLNLEHVLPKSPTDEEWPQFSADEKKDFTNRLGNMVLLRKGTNGRIGNKPFTVKKPILTASGLQLTAQAGGEEDWTPSTVKNRQEHLADLAVRVWPRRTQQD